MTQTAGEQPAKKRSASGPLQWGIIIGSWIGFFILPELFFLLWFPLLVIMFVTSWRRGLLALAFSSYAVIPVLVVMAATTGYYTGRAHLIGIGMTSYPRNLHREYRCAVGTIGCVPISYLWTALPNNVTLKALVWAFGPVKRTYHGPYPTTTAAWQTVDERGIAFSYEELRSTELTLADGETVTIDPSHFRYWQVSSEYTEYRVAVHEEQCLLVAGEDPEIGAMLLLIDRNSGEPFACYRTREEYPDG